MSNSFKDFVDLDALQALCTGFTNLFNVATAILSIEGEILISSGWQKACTQFHRKNEITATRCFESDTELASKLGDGERYNVYRCKNGLVDVAVPIIVGGCHVANLFTGQFFFEAPNRNEFTDQARNVGFDPELYLKAIDDVPIVDESEINLMMVCLCQLAENIGEIGLANKLLRESNSKLDSQNIALQKALRRAEDTEKSLINSEYLLSKVLDSIPSIIALKHNDSLDLEKLNAYGENILGVKLEGLLDKRNFDILKQPVLDFFEKIDALPTCLPRAVEGTEVVLRKSNEERFFTTKKINLEMDVEDNSHLHLIVCDDITDIVNTKKSFEHQFLYDSLTGLPNKNSLKNNLIETVLEAKKSGEIFAFLFIDFDDFKDVNDISGHDIGDALIKEAAKRLDFIIGIHDTVYRYGGDEFVVILKNIKDDISLSGLASKINDILASPYRLKNEEFYLTASIGISRYPADGETNLELLRCADQAMYSSKRRIKGSYAYFRTSMQLDANRKSEIAKALRYSLINNEFELYYQPIVDMRSGEVRKAEALLRWTNSTLGNVSPSVFIPIAEQSGMIQKIGEWVFCTALQQSIKWSSLTDKKFQVSVNKSPVQFKFKDSDVVWLNMLEDLNALGSSICIEITEGVLLDDDESVINSFNLYRDLGIEVSIDDFGTGFSALSYLNKFDVDYLKIDKSFVDKLAMSEQDFALCEAIILMANKLGIKVVAEGVETEEQVVLLAAIGCDFVQGYKYYKPMPASDLDAVLSNI